ncbi:MATE family efflux transporter [Lentilitoribacter sp. EG35]|jgi:putative MATE family efflux protein|uniref:MATE family efflux transporter n=1 Tax=Lentilitoribacter sp. EG35 TaxID=3234192 RepID=UPI00345FB50C
MSATFDLTEGSIPNHFKKIAIPAAIGMIFTTLYNVVDVFYAGLLSTDAQAGLAIAFQVFFVLVALGIGLSSAMGALVGNALGAKDNRLAKEIATQGIGYGTIASVFFGILGFFFGADLIAIITEAGAYRDAANNYFLVMLLAAPAFLLTFGANGILQAQGDTVSMERAQIAAFFANLILNPLFIFGIPGFVDGIGFTGLALSTVVSQTGVMTFILYRVWKSDLMKADAPASFTPHFPTYKDITAQALPSSFTMVVMMFSGFVIQFYLKGFGGDAVAAYGVALRVEQLLLLPAFGLTGALLPIAAQNFGAKNYDRVREAFMFCCKVGIVMMLAASGILWLAAELLMGIFSDNSEVQRIGAQYLRVDGFILPVYLVLFAINSLLQAFKKPVWTLIIGIYRQGLAVAAFVYIFVVLLDFGTLGVWLGVATSVITGLLFSIIVTEGIARKQIGGILFSKPKAVAQPS